MSALRVPALKSWQLKYWAYLTGLPTTGTKAELKALLTPALAQHKHEPPSVRLASLDMGIRNLAFCVVEPQSPGRKSDKIQIKVNAWKRMDLLESATAESAENDALGEPTNDRQSPKRTRSKASLPVPKDSFTPAALSKAAYRVTKDLLSYAPNTILIERQRFRSGGAAAIQEWTVRVNMLESMLWASLHTLQQEARGATFPSVHAISPARVAQFWSSTASLSLAPTSLFDENNSDVQAMTTHSMSDRKKIEKKDKVGIVRSWIGGTPDLDLQFDGDAAKIADAFRLSTRQSKDAKELAGGKLDDLADCLLQAVTWLKWRENRRVLDKMWQKAVDDMALGDLDRDESLDSARRPSPR
ncbi:hypothetical protein DOTSEDRAFT_72234 [Dothistroma septosporum NZE10]|uniref:Mitochondrial resolvase Ydc2 catalytic domain-containing protein n=1 Tax=Dothistroma septosporum (strain NZE10 / CBS 128990) TaxID=675120 RepID=N1PQS3_DOTSN|nr:hypothetical protein DOTSEDRAFT_72234 [Dothistroma septosporum NZE10]